MQVSEFEGLADMLLGEMREINRKAGLLTKRADEEIEAVRRKYERDFLSLKERLQGLDKEIVKLMKSNKTIFDERDKIRLTNGFLLHAKETKLSLPRDILKRIEEQGWKEGYRISKSIDRPAIEKWDDEKLSIIGAKKKPVEKFEYEVTGDI